MSDDKAKGHTLDALSGQKRKYHVTADGRVYSVAKSGSRSGSKEMRQRVNIGGYPIVHIRIDGRRRIVPVHRLVAMCFLEPKPSPRHEVRHLDGNRMNTSASNLCWGTPKDNAEDRSRHGRTSRGQRHSEAIKRGFALARAKEQTP